MTPPLSTPTAPAAVLQPRQLPLARWPAVTLFFLMMFTPGVYQPLKALLLGAVLLAIAFTAHRLHRSVLTVSAAMVVLGIFGTLIGAQNGTAGWLPCVRVFVVWPGIFTVLVAGITRLDHLRMLVKTMVIALIAVSLYSFSYIFHSAGWLPGYLYIELDQGQSVGFYDGWVESNLYSTSTLMFLVPFAIAAVMTWTGERDLPVSRITITLACLLGLGISLLTGRRALWAIIALAPLVTYAVQAFRGHRVQRGAGGKIIMWLCIIVGIGVVGFKLSSFFQLNRTQMLSEFYSAFDFRYNESNIIRAEQLEILIDNWRDHPWVGAGLGATTPGYVRSIEQPWAFELCYVALLFHTGIVGVVGYSLAVGWILLHGLGIVRRDARLAPLMVPTLVGLVCFLVATSSNPYLMKFDFMWVIFLPVAMINFRLLTQPPSTPQPGAYQPGFSR